MNIKKEKMYFIVQNLNAKIDANFAKILIYFFFEVVRLTCFFRIRLPSIFTS